MSTNNVGFRWEMLKLVILRLSLSRTAVSWRDNFSYEATQIHSSDSRKALSAELLDLTVAGEIAKYIFLFWIINVIKE